MKQDNQASSCPYAEPNPESALLPCWVARSFSEKESRDIDASLAECEVCPVYISMTGSDVCAYRVDADDRITYTSPHWEDFASRNNGMPSCSTQVLKEMSVWESFSDPESKILYRKMFDKARQHGRAIRFQTHCDSVKRLRILECTITPLPRNCLEIRFQLILEEKRNPEAILPFSEDGIITMCSYCGHLRDKAGNWKGIEQEITDQDLFGLQQLPKISHGICPDCKESFLKSINNLL